MQTINILLPAAFNQTAVPAYLDTVSDGQSAMVLILFCNGKPKGRK